jgi:ABC-type Fe3+ transport system substrate-binding protein
MTYQRLMAIVVLIAVLASLGGCGDGEEDSSARETARLERFDAEIRQRWEKGYDELPQETLVVISPNNNNIQQEFEKAFSLYYALEQGKRVEIEWREVGGGSNSILSYLRNVYSESDTAKIDVVWGGGDANFSRMAEEGILQKMKLPRGFTEEVPASFGGLAMYDPDGYWAGSAVSGFGILYNKTLLEQIGVTPPSTWDDLAAPRFRGRLALADPTKSGSALAAYEMIVQSAGSWQDGWAKLLPILGNAKRFYDGAGDAANAVITEAPVATCIDFYGVMRVTKYPDDLAYISPRGQTAYSPDPIAILKNPPHPELAQAFVYFVLSQRGQALWALPVGAKHGPVQHALYRTPIRKDVYEEFGDQLLPSIKNPFTADNEMKVNTELKQDSFRPLERLVWAAAVTNLDKLQAAKAAVDENSARRETFVQLPPNVDAQSKLPAIKQAMQDAAKADTIETNWQDYFRDKYENLTD